MGARWTWATNPCNAYPWPVATKQMTQAEFDASLDLYGVGFFGPLPMEAIVEILFRVKTFRVQADFTSPTGPPFSGDETIILPTIANEAELFADRASCANEFSGGPWDPVEGWGDYDFIDAFSYFNPLTEFSAPYTFIGSIPDNLGRYYVIEITDATGPNRYVLNAFFACLAPGWVGNRNPVDPPTSGFDAELVLQCGTFSIPMALYNFSDYSGTLVITANEWWTYAKATGGDQFDASSGVFQP